MCACKSRIKPLTASRFSPLSLFDTFPDPIESHQCKRDHSSPFRGLVSLGMASFPFISVFVLEIHIRGFRCQQATAHQRQDTHTGLGFGNLLSYSFFLFPLHSLHSVSFFYRSEGLSHILKCNPSHTQRGQAIKNSKYERHKKYWDHLRGIEERKERKHQWRVTAIGCCGCLLFTWEVLGEKYSNEKKGRPSSWLLLILSMIFIFVKKI